MRSTPGSRSGGPGGTELAQVAERACAGMAIGVGVVAAAWAEPLDADHRISLTTARLRLGVAVAGMVDVGRARTEPPIGATVGPI